MTTDITETTTTRSGPAIRTGTSTGETSCGCDRPHDLDAARDTALDADVELTGELPDEELLYDLADLFKVFADTTRIRILYALMGQSLCVAHIAEEVGVSQSAVSHQLRSLKQAHLVRCRREGKQVVYSLSDSHVMTMLSQGLEHVCE